MDSDRLRFLLVFVVEFKNREV